MTSYEMLEDKKKKNATVVSELKLIVMGHFSIILSNLRIIYTEAESSHGQKYVMDLLLSARSGIMI